MFHIIVKTKCVILSRIKGCVVVSSVKSRKTTALFWWSNAFWSLFWWSNAFWLMKFEGVHTKYVNMWIKMIKVSKQAILITSTNIQNSIPSVGPNGVTIVSHLQVSNQVIRLVQICLIVLLWFMKAMNYMWIKTPCKLFLHSFPYFLHFIMSDPF